MFILSIYDMINIDFKSSISKMAINILVSRTYAKLGYELYRYDIDMGFSSIKRIDRSK
jgi:hypothetical protein